MKAGLTRRALLALAALLPWTKWAKAQAAEYPGDPDVIGDGDTYELTPEEITDLLERQRACGGEET